MFKVIYLISCISIILLVNTCVVSAYVLCATDTDCTDDEYCDEGICMDSCSQDSDCEPTGVQYQRQLCIDSKCGTIYDSDHDGLYDGSVLTPEQQNERPSIYFDCDDSSQFCTTECINSDPCTGDCADSDSCGKDDCKQGFRDYEIWDCKDFCMDVDGDGACDKEKSLRILPKEFYDDMSFDDKELFDEAGFDHDTYQKFSSFYDSYYQDQGFLFISQMSAGNHDYMMKIYKDMDDSDDSVSPFIPEIGVCDMFDNDFDGVIDECKDNSDMISVRATSTGDEGKCLVHDYGFQSVVPVNTEAVSLEDMLEGLKAGDNCVGDYRLYHRLPNDNVLMYRNCISGEDCEVYSADVDDLGDSETWFHMNNLARGSDSACDNEVFDTHNCCYSPEFVSTSSNVYEFYWEPEPDDTECDWSGEGALDGVCSSGFCIAAPESGMEFMEDAGSLGSLSPLGKKINTFSSMVYESCIYSERPDSSEIWGCQIFDSDGDTYLNASFGCPLCTDCDDSDPDVYPGAPDDDPERDMNCNGVAGETKNSDSDSIPDIFEGAGCVLQGSLVGPVDAHGCWFSTSNGNLADLGWSS